MSSLRHRLVTTAMLLTGAIGLPAMADTFISFAASDSVAISLGTSSASFGHSSDASSHHRRHGFRHAQGDYKVIDLAAAEGRPGMARLTLQATTDRGEDTEFYLYLPQPVVERQRLAQGQLVQAQPRPYGVAFAQGEPRQPFFLVIDDALQRELQTQPVSL
ncbi:MAG: hypothetical protein IPP87_19145 [Ideonella sp.]|nr:hypothetical protein [Ideonella sp.]MBL0150678.1 hypothetical protein [Ideonella sp.]